MEKVHFFTVKNTSILLLCILCVGTYLFCADQLLRSTSVNAQNEKHSFYLNILEKRKRGEEPLVPNYIKGWMTFAYIDHLFNLSPTYLEKSLKLNDVSLPNISLNDYAEDHNLNKTSFLTEIIHNISEAQYNGTASTTTTLVLHQPQQ